LERVGEPWSAADADGEWIGLVKLSDRGAGLVRQELDAMAEDGSLTRAGIPELLNRLAAAGHKARVVYVTGHWMDVNDVFDLASARNFM
jgi:phosphoenolpyruvate phosphomutase